MITPYHIWDRLSGYREISHGLPNGWKKGMYSRRGRAEREMEGKESSACAWALSFSFLCENRQETFWILVIATDMLVCYLSWHWVSFVLQPTSNEGYINKIRTRLEEDSVARKVSPWLHSIIHPPSPLPPTKVGLFFVYTFLRNCSPTPP